MTHSHKKLSPVVAVVAVLLSLTVHAGDGGEAYGRSERLVVFGDSLSDTGNKHAQRGVVNEPPYDGLNEFGVPADPYLTAEGIYFSNGPVWIEAVGSALDNFGGSRPADGRWPHARNYAWGGARAVAPVADDGNHHLDAQVTAYLQDVDHDVAPTTIHVLFIGGNDMVDALVMLGSGAGFQDVLIRLAATVGAVDGNLQRLIDAGARRFVLMNVPDVGMVPAVASPGGKALMSCFAEMVNEGGTSACPNIPVTLQLPDSLGSIGARLASQGFDVTAVDTFAFIRAIGAVPASFGFANVTDACVTPLLAPYDCAEPDSYLFWDGLHPTKATHRLLAALVINRLGL